MQKRPGRLLNETLAELRLKYQTELIEVGCDEAGRGCLAGPVVAAAVILPDDFDNALLNDSKQLTHNQREEIRPIIEDRAISFGVGIVSNEEIDEINILNASFLAMHRAIDQLNSPAELILVDGNRFKPYRNLPHKCLVKGDARFKSIAAASIIAKTYRDKLMVEFHDGHPYYDWDKNKGYPTKKHRAAIAKYGITQLHRKTFNLLP